MSERTLEDALARAKSLRNFKATNYERFERCPDFEDLVALADEVERHRALQDRSDAAYGSAKLDKVVDDMISRLDVGDKDGACDVFDAVIVNGFGDAMFEAARPGELGKFWKDIRGMLIAMHARRMVLADEVERLRSQVEGLISFAAEARGTAMAERAIERTYSDDESW